MSTEMEAMVLNEAGLHKEVVLRLYYYMAYLHFGAGQHNKALHWINRVINDNENDLRQDLYGYARLLNIVLHYELGNSDLLEYTIKSTSRYLQKRMRDFEIEKLILEQFKKLIRLRNASAKKTQLMEFQSKLSQLAAGDECKALFRYLDFSTWIEAQLKNVTLEAIFQHR